MSALPASTIAALAPLIARRDVSPVEVTGAVLDHITALEPQLNAFITLTADAARAAARAAEARDRGRELRQVATLELAGQASARVELCELGADDPLAGLPGAGNAVVLEHCDGRRTRLAGAGAGRWPTAEAVLGDLLALARGPAARYPASSSFSSSRSREAELMQ